MNSLISSGKTQVFLVLLLASCMILACKKDTEDNPIITDASQRIAEILLQRGGINTFKDVCYYDDHRVSSYCRYRWTDEGDWKNWVRYLFEYQGKDRVVEVMEGVSDTNWFPAKKWEKQFQDGRITEIIEANWTPGEPGYWEPLIKISWTYDGEKLIKKRKYKYENAAWKDCWKMDYHYTGKLWSSATCLENNDGRWDTIKCLYMNYSGGKLLEVNIYNQGYELEWVFDKQYLFEYDGQRMTRMIVNEAYGDSLRMEISLSIRYNEHGHPVSYTEEYECCPTQYTSISYAPEDGKGQLPFHNKFAWDLYPWVPSPHKE